MRSTRDELVAEVVVALTDTLSDGFDVADLLYTLTTACVELLDVDAAGVLLVDEQGRLVPVAATHGGSENLENLQILVKEGPCLDAVRASGTVRSTDLDDDVDRWPASARLARAEGFRAAHAEPVARHAEVVGGLNLFRRAPGPLPDTDQRIAHFLGTAAAIGILHRRAQTNVETVNQQLEHALTSSGRHRAGQGVPRRAPRPRPGYGLRPAPRPRPQPATAADGGRPCRPRPLARPRLRARGARLRCGWCPGQPDRVGVGVDERSLRGARLADDVDG